MITTVCKISYGSQTVPPIVPAVQGDTGRAISFEIADFTPPAGATATYFILKPSGEAIYNSATITDNSILCELTAQSLAEAGENRMQVRVLQGEDIVTSFEVILMVRTFLGDDAIESGTEMNIFDQAVEQATEQFQENAEQIVEEVIESIPADYTELTEEVDELNERLDSIAQYNINLPFSYTSACVYGNTVGQIINPTPVSHDDYRCGIYECSAGDTFYIKSTGGSAVRAWGFVDSSNAILSVAKWGAVDETITAPATTAKLFYNDLSGTGVVTKLGTPGRLDELEDTVDEIIDENDTWKVISRRKISTESYIDGQFIDQNGILQSRPDNTNFKCTDFISLNASDTIVSIPATNIVNNQYISMVAYYSDNTYSSFISSVTPSASPILSRIPENANYVIFGSNTTMQSVYNPLNADIEIQGVANRYNPQTEEKASLVCPQSYDLIVGDTFELFYKGIIDSFNSDAFYISASCPIGSGYKKKYIVTPTEAGSYDLVLKLYDSNDAIIDQKTIALVVKSTPTSPATLKNILCVGDSLTQNGVWVGEMKRRLCNTGGTPTGFNLSNIAFIGTCSNEGANYEGYVGFTFAKYNTNYISVDAKLITCTHDKTEAEDQHSVYADGVGNRWKLETINTNNIKIILVSGTASTIPSSGTLTWVSGGVNHSAITYTAVSDVTGNPFWNDSLNKVDFASYASSLDVSSIDYVYVLLGWNDWWNSINNIKTQAQTFITNVHASFPDAKVVLIGLEIPALDGLGTNYGSYTGIISNYISMLQFVHDIDAIYEELVNENTNVYHVNLSGQFDTEHNMPQSTRAVNTRNSETETYQSNGIHPANSGYLQIADATTRHFVSIL